MPPRRKAPKSKAASVSTRVHKIKSKEQWETMLRKAGSNRLVIVQFYQQNLWACKQLRPFFVKYSIQPKFRKAIFAEVEVDELEDLARSLGIQKIPTYMCFFEGERVDTYVGGVVDQMQDLIARNVKEYSVSGGPLAVALKLAAAAAVVAGGTFLALKFGGSQSDSAPVDAGAQILDLKKRIMTAQGRLRNLERANRGKQARAQRKLIDQLTAQVRALEKKESGSKKVLPVAEGAAAEQDGGRPTATAAEAKAEGGRKAASQRRPGLSIDEVARIRRRKERGEVLYSDEEDVLVTAETNPPQW